MTRKNNVLVIFIMLALGTAPACGYRFSRALASLDSKIGSFQASITDETQGFRTPDENRRLEKELVDVIIQLSRLAVTRPDHAGLEWRLGECHRLGHLLTLPEAWTESERHLKVALAIDPAYIPARCSLGQLYLQGGSDFSLKAEQEFRQALESASSALPQAHKGLFYAYCYQARFEDALKEAEKYESLEPGDNDFGKAKALALTNLKIQTRTKT